MAKTAGSQLSWLVLAGLGATAGAIKAGCAPIPHEEGKSWIESVVVADVLAAVGPQVVEPSLARFRSSLDALDASLSSWEATHEAGSDTTSARQDARDQWLAAMLVWQELEAMQVGPAGSSLDTIGGEDLRDEIYSWPTVNPCRIDQETINAGWKESGWFEENLVNSYGLDGLEQLVYGGNDNICPNQVDINADGTWDAAGPDAIEAARIGYARVLTAHLQQQTDALLTEWSADGGNFSGALALTAASPYEDEQAALNAVFNAMFYLEIMAKERKLMQPMGQLECSTDTCPDNAEHVVSGVSTLAIHANLVGFRLLFTGGDGPGMDDLLTELGHADLAAEVLAATDHAISVAESTTVSIDTGVQTDFAAIQALYDAVDGVTELLSTDVVTVLALEVPAEAAGDAD
jgi:predicted lipoprotein